MGTITSANTILTLSQPILFGNPVQIQKFAADDLTDTDQMRIIEAIMGVDGTLSFGFVFVPTMQNITLQANSPSVSFFDTINLQQRAAKDVYTLTGTLLFPTLAKKFVMNNGALTTYKPTPDAKRTLQPQRFQVTWESVLPAPQ
jgi:hypothetical protein